MELSSEDPLPMALDLSKRCEKSHRNPRTTEVLELVKKPGWHSISDDHHVSMPCMQILSEKTLADTGVRLSYGNRSCVHSPLLHNGLDRSLRDSGLYELNPTESPNVESPISDSMDGDGSQSDSDSVILLVSSSKEAPQNYINRGSFSPLVKPLSPGAVSLDEAKDCFLLPQTMSSPSPDNTYSEDSSESMAEMSVNTKPVLSLAELAAVYGKSVRSTVDMSSDDSDVIEVPITNENKKNPSFRVGCQNEKRLTGEPSNTGRKSFSPEPGRLRPIVTAQKPISNVICHNSIIHTKNTSTKLQKDHSGDTVDSKEKSSSSEDESWLQPTVHLYRCVVDSDDSDVDHRTVRLDPSQSLSSSRRPLRRSSLATESSPKSSYMKDVQQEPTTHSSVSTQASRTQQETHTRSPAKEPVAFGSKAAASKTRNAKKQRKKKHKKAGSSLFSPQEPEIKLKYASYKNDKRDSKSENFSPFVHMEQREYSACTVVNYQQEVKDVRQNKGQQKQPTGSVFLSGVVPKTSCYGLGRLSSRSKCQPLMVCCLCGGSANAIGLGDLHGPYYPNGPAVEEQVQKEDQKASELSVDSCGQVDKNGLRGPCNGPRTEAVDEGCCIVVSDCESSPLPSAKKLRTNCVVDSHSLPLVPHNTSERWIHEDCGIWSTGVFLVKGKLYGLEEAVRLAQETVCSTCHAAGATMGCIQKGCPNKYHYTCALQSGCVLNEENFSMRCPKHKKKTFRGLNMPDNR